MGERWESGERGVGERGLEQANYWSEDKVNRWIKFLILDEMEWEVGKKLTVRWGWTENFLFITSITCP